jgi:hypothetical protein
MKLRRGSVRLCFVFANLATAASAQPLALYRDALENGWQNFSYGGGSDFANAAPTQAGSASIAFTGNNFNAVSFALDSSSVSTASYPTLRFFVHGGTAGAQQLRLFVQRNNAIVGEVEIDAFIAGGSIAAGQWREVTIPLAATSPPLDGAFDRIDLQSDQAAPQPVLYLDEVSLLPPSPAVLLSSSFENGEGPSPPPANLLAIERSVMVDGMLSERYTWRDGADRPRLAAFAHNTGQVGPSGQRGGELWRYEYEAAGATRVVRASNQFAGGFGYVVSHRNEGATGIAGDDSPLGHGFSGQLQRLFEGRHHAILRFTQTYPRHSRTGASPPNTQYQVPVTIDWLVATGRDHPLWSITWDLCPNSAPPACLVPADALNDDSRAPYGELLFDGSANLAAHSVIAGVGWGDRFKFVSTDAPVTLASNWTWNAPNSVPYVKLWTTAVDATMGTVLTRTILQQDAGGYFGTNRWNTTSAAGFACTQFGNNYRMPCDFNWPYQAINYSFGGTATPTNNTRLAWGTNFGFLGQQSYPIHGSAFWGGPLPNEFRSGYPRVSYSSFIVLGRHTLSPVENQIGEIEVVQNTTLTASIGSVATSGPAGINRPAADNTSYAPVGWNHVYGVWALAATGNRIDANFALAAGSLARPVLVLSNWTTGTVPVEVRFNGSVLAPDADYFASPRADRDELWLTLDHTLAGASNRIEVR